MHYKCNSSHNCAICQMHIVPRTVPFGTGAKGKGLQENHSIPGSATSSSSDLGERFLAKTGRPFSTSVTAHATLF